MVDYHQTISMADEKTFCSNTYRLKIKIFILEETHDGYCSDPDELVVKSREKFIFREIPATLNDRDLFDSHKRLKDISTLNNLNSETSHGNGYCGCKTRVDVKSAKLIRKS